MCSDACAEGGIRWKPEFVTNVDVRSLSGSLFKELLQLFRLITEHQNLEELSLNTTWHSFPPESKVDVQDSLPGGLKVDPCVLVWVIYVLFFTDYCRTAVSGEIYIYDLLPKYQSRTCRHKDCVTIVSVVKG